METDGRGCFDRIRGESMRNEISRRDLMKRGALATALVPVLALIGNDARAADLAPLDPNDGAAKSLGFVADASKVDASANPTFKSGQRCATCVLYQGKPTDARGACSIFSGRSVPAEGWCRVWSQRSG
jgi:hypothetical protein